MLDPGSAAGDDATVPKTDATHEVTDIEFDSDATTLRGWLYRPSGRAEAAPAVVMAHGYNCIKELYLDQYAAVTGQEPPAMLEELRVAATRAVKVS